MRRGTTPTIRINLNTDITAYRLAIAIEDEYGNKILLDDDRITADATSATATLTQAESRSLQGNRIYVQLRAYDASGTPSTETQIMMDALMDDIVGEVEV